MTTIHNKYKEPYDIYIGRGSIFGNPWVIGTHGTRDEVIDRYEEYFAEKLNSDPAFKAAVLGAKGKKLGCFCKPLRCHGDVICNYLNQLK